ncbi:MAG: ABC transporter substrate-binding protein [Lewinellaceae bacterium]|nr:ABC transporter substrate-binding protein [Phaeodactylibacter sp.]MCB0612629.1 ABC transporter substrate-binding protein [Phaeodactylibacter sp.]MCB9346838.1 ABC transporter substrate-binding protein [Lewinellaceae bacterium]
MKHFNVSYIIIALLLLLWAGCKTDPKPKGEDVIFSLNRPLNEAAIQLDAEPDRLNVPLSTSAFARLVCNSIFQNLLSIDPQSLEIIPQLAKARPTATPITEGPYAGGMAYTFEIHSQATWDNGSPVTAEDFIFTLKAALNPQVPAPAYRAYLSFIKDIQVDPDNPRRFTVLTGQKYIIGEEAIGSALPIMPAYHYDPDGLLKDIPLTSLTDESKAKELAATDERLAQFATLFTSPKYSREKEGISGSGPYRFENWETGQRIIVSKKENYWAEELMEEYPALAGYPDKIVFQPIPDANAAITALKDGQIDAMANIPPNDFTDLQKNDFTARRYNFYSPPLLGNTFIYINTRIPKLSDKRVRKALAYAIDAEEIINTVYNGLGKPYASPVHPSFAYYNNDLQPIPYDPEKARQLLAEAGWADTDNNGIADKVINGKKEELSLNYKVIAGRDNLQNVALLVQESAKKAGIDIQIEAKEFAVLADDFKRRDFELAPWGKTIQPTLWEPKQDFHSEGDDRTGFASAESDALIDQIQITLDEQERNKLYKQLQAKLYDEMPLIYLLVPTSRIAIHKRFETRPSPMYPGYSPNEMKLIKR